MGEPATLTNLLLGFVVLELGVLIPIWGKLAKKLARLVEVYPVPPRERSRATSEPAS